MVHSGSAHSSLCCQVCHVGDALAEDAAVPGGFAGIVVDLFAEGQVLPALQQVMTAPLWPPTHRSRSSAYVHCNEMRCVAMQTTGFMGGFLCCSL